jgi:vitamin B12 transporter
MNNKIVRISTLVVLMTNCVFAQQKDSIVSNTQLDEVVISDSKFALSKEKSGKVITKITAEDLKKREGESIAAVLNSAVGVQINGSQSVAGKNLNYYIRGGKSSQVLILIDGVPVTDASGISFEYDLRLLPADQVESIEIMKGASSTLYGTGAATAVINITLKKAGRKKIEGNAYFNVGTNNTASTSKTAAEDYNQGVSVSGNANKLNYIASLNSTETDGMSKIAPLNSSDDYEADRFSRLNYMAKLGYKTTDNLTLDFFGNFDKVYNDYDSSFDNTGTNDTALNHSKTEQFRFGFIPKYKYDKGEMVLNASFNKVSRVYNEWNSYSETTDVSQYDSRSVNVDGYNKYVMTQSLFLVSGVQYQFHDMNSVSTYSSIAKEGTKFNMVDPYFTGVYNSDFGFNLNAGARLNSHSDYGNHVVYNVNPSYDFKSFPLKVLSSYSTAFITPSLYQLYSAYGNSDLTPENNSTFEAGIETELLAHKLKISTVGFFRSQTNYIAFSSSYQYVNIDGTYKTKGIETEMAYAVNDKIKTAANYTFTQVDDALDRLIAKHKLNASVDAQLTQKMAFSVNYQYVGSRKDSYYDGNTYTTAYLTLGSYQLVNTTFRYQVINNRLSVFGSVNNILNADFVENVGYNTLGRNFKLGLNIAL